MRTLRRNVATLPSDLALKWKINLVLVQNLMFSVQ